MPEGLKLAQEYDSLVKYGSITLAPETVPALIRDNINPALVLRPYQINAIRRFTYHADNNLGNVEQMQLLFNMATGSGKTLIMAMCMLYLYDAGYRNFVFFVDKTNIIKKTKENFLNPTSNKYLFNKKGIVIDGKSVAVREVQGFTESAPNAINIYFSTIGGLHSRMHNPKENTVSIADFAKDKTVFISDEAHHINAETKNKLTKEEQENKRSWEATVRKLVSTHTDNVLLEFTATINWEDSLLYEKYKSRVLFEYDLKKFREDKYSKDVFLVQSDSEIKDRMIQAIVVSQYRRAIAADHGIALKPVILMKSKTVAESLDNQAAFNELLANLNQKDLEKNAKLAEKAGNDAKVISDAFAYFAGKYDKLIPQLQTEFAEDKQINANKEEDKEAHQIALNSLEDDSNPIRIVFAVDKLNEGWDVLNLFDIVRLYGTRDSGKPTNAEAQLVGRGARYSPFVYEKYDTKYQRKFDEQEDHPLRALEQLHFHSLQNSKYISELRTALIKSGIHKSEGRSVTIRVKDSFKKTHLYKQGVVWKNKRIINDRKEVAGLKSYNVPMSFEISLGNTGKLTSEQAFGKPAKNNNPENKKPDSMKITKLSPALVRKALDQVPFFHFTNLRKYFPQIDSLNQFASGAEYLGGISLNIKNNSDKIDNRELLPKLVAILENIKNTIKSNSSEYVGSKDFVAEPIKQVLVDRTMYIEKPKEGSSKEFGLSMSDSKVAQLNLGADDADFYVYSDDYGTDEEKHLVKTIYNKQDELFADCAGVYLIRNQKILELYDFKEGRRFEPDYILFLDKSDKKEKLYYQIFIEPKGAQLEDGDRWKEDFLKEIGTEKSVLELFKDDKYYIYGLPFYQKKKEDEVFLPALNTLIEKSG